MSLTTANSYFNATTVEGCFVFSDISHLSSIPHHHRTLRKNKVRILMNNSTVFVNNEGLYKSQRVSCRHQVQSRSTSNEEGCQFAPTCVTHIVARILPRVIIWRYCTCWAWTTQYDISDTSLSEFKLYNRPRHIKNKNIPRFDSIRRPPTVHP